MSVEQSGPVFVSTLWVRDVPLAGVYSPGLDVDH